MKLIVYKGFDETFLSHLAQTPLIDEPIACRTNVLQYDKMTKKRLDMALLALDEDQTAWITYEEYTLIRARVDDAVAEYDLKVVLYRNNIYPECFPIPFGLSDALVQEIRQALDSDSTADCSEACRRFLAVYSALMDADGIWYGSFYNYEYDRDANLSVRDYYPNEIAVESSLTQADDHIFLNDDVEAYLRDLSRIMRTEPAVIGLASTNGMVSKRMQQSLQAYCVLRGIRLTDHCPALEEDAALEQELEEIARNDVGIRGFTGFRKIKFYKNPDTDKEVIELSQGQIIREIIRQAENAYRDEPDRSFRDVFMTASTGAGKSVIFQIPAVYLARKYNKLTIIIEPVKALMQDQKQNLNRNGYTRVETFNSDLISQVEKEAVIKRIKNGEVDLLYLSPETLLSYSIETIIGDREIGLLIVDEAHIVTTWGVGFRPDYWYLGGYLNKLRTQPRRAAGGKRRTYRFPICACTATAINGGTDDSVSDTIVSLYMENPIKYIGYVRRDDIRFEITHKGPETRLPKAEYEQAKARALNIRLRFWLAHRAKTIVYFPYASLAGDAAKGVRAFAGVTVDKRIGMYTGRNIQAMSTEAFNESKRRTFEAFRTGEKPIMLATKAFGMGVDVDDVANVYHYAVTGNLCDYVQEIGRAARKVGMTGAAVTDYYNGDITFMRVLFGMSQIRQYQIKEVLRGIYDAYLSKNERRNFLISPESFTYIFHDGKDENACINKLKTCLLMIEKDFYDKYNFKVLISRPQSVFTKAFICVHSDAEARVLSSRYGNCLTFIQKGRRQEVQANGSWISDVGDIYAIDLKRIWESFYPNISFPQFKYWYFNANSDSPDKVEIMPDIREYISPRHKVNIEARRDMRLSELRPAILEDFEDIADLLYANFRRKFFTTEEFANLLREKYGKGKARIIANSLFELVDPKCDCVKRRHNDATGRTGYFLANGNFKEMMRRPIIRSSIVSNITKKTDASAYSGYLCLTSTESSDVALKLLSIFDYITYEILGGEEPEIFIRLNDPNKVRQIVMGEAFYSNHYVTKAKQKHERDVKILLRFFNELQTDKERWDYIEDYFLGYDVLENAQPAPQSEQTAVKIDKEHSYPTAAFDGWNALLSFFDENEQIMVRKLIANDVPIPEYLQTVIRQSEAGNDILMSWASKHTLICQQDTSDATLTFFRSGGWNAHRIHDLDPDTLKEELR